LPRLKFKSPSAMVGFFVFKKKVSLAFIWVFFPLNSSP